MLKYTFYVVMNVASMIANMVPKRKTLWIFSAWNGKQFSDNSKYLYLYVKQNRSEIEAVWCAKTKQAYRNLVALEIPCFYAYSLKGMVYQMRAGVVLFTHSVDWDLCSFFIGKKTRRIQLWHGIPLKMIGQDDNLNRTSKLTEIVMKVFMNFRAQKFDFIIAAGEEDKKIYQTAFNIGPEKVRVTGLPRNDILLSSGKEDNSRTATNIIYMPTFRGSPNSEFLLFEDTDFSFDKIDQWLIDRDVTFHIKLHPVNRLSFSTLQKIKKCRAIFLANNEEDIYAMLKNYEILITDFSSIYFDFLATGKSIILAPLRMSDYLTQDREGLYFDVNELAPDGICKTWKEVFAQVEKYLSFEDEGSSYRTIQKRFHHYLDNKSSHRVCAEILKTLE